MPVQVAALPEGKNFGEVADSFFTKAVLSTEGRFGAYGAPTDVKVLAPSDKSAKTRTLEIAFAALLVVAAVRMVRRFRPAPASS